MGGKTLRAAKGIFEYEYIRSQMEKSNWNISRAAEKLGMQQPNLTRKLKELGIKKG
jgi:DNA-binding NtrC family response regulator